MRMKALLSALVCIKILYIYYIYTMKKISYDEFVKLMAKNKELWDADDREGCINLYLTYIAPLGHKLFDLYQKRYTAEHVPKKVVYYFFTFTLKPGADAEKAELYINGIRHRMENLSLYDLAYCIEHEATNKHFHVMIGAYRAIRSDAFKHYAQIYGFVHRSNRISQTDIQIVDYMTKENSIYWLIKDGKLL